MIDVMHPKDDPLAKLWICAGAIPILENAFENSEASKSRESRFATGWAGRVPERAGDRSASTGYEDEERSAAKVKPDDGK